eukprot:TRINITY_DN8982_c0_g1_i2.p1 TRINITY_DN8982_c0_g1~~TRINITY_DN8982_c0_g1_i2.p1  ORF type:complete len:176 (+),score=38.60 TRINITY_DN8982_c0_g1_i2:16-543(+)
MQVNPQRTLYVGGLYESCTEDLIKAAFLPFGDIVSVNVPVDQNTQKCRGFAFVEYEETDDARQAVDNMHHAELFGKVITCTIAKVSSGTGESRPVWEDETFIAELERGVAEGVVSESTITVNSTRRPKPDGPYQVTPASTAVVPIGMVRCQGCGGFGKDLVKENGFCNHCNSKRK